MTSKDSEELDLAVFANPLKDLEFKKPKRIDSIDLVKGFAMVFILIAHTSGVWFDDDWIFMHGQVYAVLDVLGPSLFIFLSALSVVFSVKSKQGKIPEYAIRNKIFMRGLVIIGIGLLYNLFIPGFTQGENPLPFPLVIWSWSILVFIGFSQIFAYYSLKIPKIARVIFALIIIAVTLPIRFWLADNMDSNEIIWWIHFIIVSPYPHVPLFPYLSFCFLSTLFGELLYETMIDGSPEAYNHLVKQYLMWGIILVAAGILIGFRLYHYSDSSPYPKLEFNEWMSIKLLYFANTNPWFDYPGMPAFLIRGMPSNQFYSLGMALIIMGIAFYLVDIKRHDNHLIRILKYYGQISLSIFLFHYIGLVLLFPYAFNIVFFPFICISFIGFIGLLFYIWFKYADGVGSPEWIMIKLGQKGKKRK
ncbi:MAG: heparan-alpha-glucosaminide N-acetyltransferase domain-containing protein [Promethearchaeota archaeon]